MDKVDQKSLLNQIAYYSRLIEEHEASQKAKKLNSSSFQQSTQNSSLKQQSVSGYKAVKNLPQPGTSFNQKYSFQNSKSCGATFNNKRTVLYNQNFKAKYTLSKNQTPKCVSPVNKTAFKNILNNNRLVVHKASIVSSENKSDKALSSDSPKKLTSETKVLIKNIESVTELLKKRSSINQPKLQTSSVMNYKNDVQNGLLKHKSSKYSAFNNFKPVQNGTMLSKSENRAKLSPRIIPGNSKSLSNSYTKVNVFNRNNPHQLKTFNSSKFCYKNANMKQASNAKANNLSLKTVRVVHQPKNKFQKIVPAPHSRKIIFSDPKSLLGDSSGNNSTFASKSSQLDKRELIIELTSTKEPVNFTPNSKMNKKSNTDKFPSLFKIRSPSISKSVKSMKLKPGGVNYTKINKNSIIPNKILREKYSINHKISSSKKTKKKVNSKYKVINKTFTPCANRKAVNSLCNVGLIKSSPLKMNSDPVLEDLNESAIDKLEKNLLAMSTALTATPISEECNVIDGPSIPKSVKVTKPKPGDTSFTKINKHLIIPNKILREKYSINHKTFSSKKTKKRVNSKYKVINKTATPCANRKAVNSSCSVESRKNSPLKRNSDPVLKDINDSVIDKLEKNLLAMSTALTATPVSGKCNVSASKALQKSRNKCNSKYSLRKTSLKNSKKRISKYKIINSKVPQSYSLKRKQSLTYPRTAVKKIKHSKFSLINKHLQPVHVIAPLKQGKSILVRRIFKSKNAIINKNASPTNYSAKMIKSKYLTLNKRKSLVWHKHNSFPKVPLHHPKFKGHSLIAKLHPKQNKYQKTAISAYHLRRCRKYTSYGCQTSSTQYTKNVNGKIYGRKVKNGYARPPVVFIHGMRYSVNSSGKTLKKLPLKGHSAKTFRRRSSSKVFVRNPENSVKTSAPVSTNLASRVLHRSINRILTASSKKSLMKVNAYCMFYNRFGRCNRGVKCTYIHDPSKIAVCTRFLRGTCKIDGCPFSHEITPGKMAICSFFLVGNCDKENCPYRHEKLLPNAVLCKAFVQGYCPSGKECTKAHILICPKYMQGECDKGSSCAFPHPPQKAKKNVQKEVEDEEKKPADVLLEKVLRYFQRGGDCALPSENISCENNTANLFVPKHRKKLEEQPSFIPL